MEEKLKSYTSNQLKGIIESNLPDKKGYSKLRKELLINIIIENNLSLVTANTVETNKQLPVFSIRHGIFSPFHPDVTKRYVYTDGK